MSSLLHPTGSEPPQVYWRRRAVVLVAVLVLVIVVVVVWPKGSPPAEPAVIASPSAVSPSASVGGLVSPTPAATPAAPQPCLTENLQLELSGSGKLVQGSKQSFKAAVTNTGEASCVLSLTATNFTLTVTSGSDRIWSTEDCAKWVPAKTLTVKPQGSYRFQIAWPLVRSQATCTTTKTPVKPGTYVGKATLSGTLTDRVVMLITAKS